MSSRRDSLRRVRKLNKITRGHSFTRDYHWESEEGSGSASAVITAVIIFVAVALIAFGLFVLAKNRVNTSTDASKSPETKTIDTAVATDEPVHTAPPVAYEPEVELMSSTATFLQGPKAWKNKADWSGYWGDYEIDGRRFGSFGCGLCCMANFYSSITPYECSPLDIYEYSKRVSSYEGASAIDWPHIQTVMEKLGFSVDTGRKPKKYNSFKRLIAQAEAVMVVVSSNYDDSFWKNTPGHYVTLWDYNESDDTVFLGDSGSSARNRRVIPLKTVYKAIKKSNDLHYMRMLSYDEKRDGWKHEGISGDWCQPEYWSKQ